jgi:hypothetical protein
MIIKILALLGILFLLVVVSIGAWLFRIIKIVRRANKSASNIAKLPARVNLELEANPQWHNAKLINDYANQLRALGFEDVGAYSITEMGGLMILGLVHPGEGLMSVIYDHTQCPVSFEIDANFADDSSVSASSSSMGSTLDKRPNHPILWLGTTDARAVLQAARNHVGTAPRKPITKTDFTTEFKKGYARGVNWRLKKGGASREEIRRQAEKKGYKFTDEQIEESYQNLRTAYLQQLQSCCIAQFLDDQKPSADEWERIRLHAFAVAETLEPKEIIETIDSYCLLDEEQRRQLDKVEKNFGDTAVAVMGKILDQNIAALGLVKLGEVTEPVNAVILKAPSAAEGQRVLHAINTGELKACR